MPPLGLFMGGFTTVSWEGGNPGAHWQHVSKWGSRTPCTSSQLEKLPADWIY